MRSHLSDNPCLSVWSCEQSCSSPVPSLSLPSDASAGSKTSTPQLSLKVDLSKGSSKSHHSYKAVHSISSHENDLSNKSSDKDSGAAILHKHGLSAKHHLKDSKIQPIATVQFINRPNDTPLAITIEQKSCSTELSCLALHQISI